MMSRMLKGISVALCVVTLVACSPSAEKVPGEIAQNQEALRNEEEIIVEATPVRDFDNLDTLPKSKQRQPIESITKLVFLASTEIPGDAYIAIDLGNKAMYSNPIDTIIGLTDPDVPLTNADIVKIQSILAKYDVQGWDEDYSSGETGYEDGFGWWLKIEYDDRTVEMHYGAGPTEEGVVPDNYYEFVEELLAFGK